MIEKLLILPDVHLDTTLPKPYKLIKKFLRKNKFDEIILLGDFMDCSALSHWIKDKRKLLEGKRHKKELELVDKELNCLASKTKKLVYIEGNHEDWINQYVEKYPEMEGLVEIVENTTAKFKWIQMNKLYKKGHLYFTHGMYANKYHSNKHLINLGCNIVYGHVHRTQSDMMNMKMQKPIMGWALGCLCDKEPFYMRKKPANWINGFGIIYVNTENGNFNMYPINIINNRFIWNGKEYK